MITVNRQTEKTEQPPFDRRLYINAVRGIAILAMLWGHCIQYCCTDEFDFFENIVFRVIYSFHMPLFMLVSGYLFFFSLQKRDFKTLIVHRTQSMLQPIIMVQILAYFLRTGFQACLRQQWDLLLDGLDGQWAGTFGSALLWFLWSVLCLSIVAAVAFRLVQNKALRCVVLLLGVGFVALFPNAEMHIFMYPFFFGGFLYAKYERQIPKCVYLLRYCTLVLFPLMLPFFHRDQYIYTTGLFGSGDWSRQILIDLFRWAIGFVGSIFMLTVLEMLFKIPDKNYVGRIVRPIAKAGEKSLEIYTLSVIFLSGWLPKACQIAVSWAGYNFLTTNIHLYSFVYMPLLAAAYAFALLMLTRLLQKWGIGKIIFGRS